MNKDIFEGKWDQWIGKMKEHWGKLTDDDWKQIQGKKDQLIGRLQERYGWDKAHAEAQVKKFESDLKSLDDEDFPHKKAQ